MDMNFILASIGVFLVAADYHDHNSFPFWYFI